MGAPKVGRMVALTQTNSPWRDAGSLRGAFSLAPAPGFRAAMPLPRPSAALLSARRETVREQGAKNRHRPHKPKTAKPVGWWVFATWFAGLGLIAFDSAPEAQSARVAPLVEPREAQVNPAEDKISPLIGITVRRMKAAGITRENAQRRGAAAFSTPPVKVDAAGKIQLYVYLERVDPQVLAALEARGFRIERSSTALKLVQGWALFDDIEHVGALEGVERVTAPSYGVLQY